MPVEKFLQSLTYNVHPEWELRMWRIVGLVYEKEVHKRRAIERKKLFKFLLCASFYPHLSLILMLDASVNPTSFHFVNTREWCLSSPERIVNLIKQKQEEVIYGYAKCKLLITEVI